MLDSIKRFYNSFLVEGLFLLIVGALLMILPAVSTLAVGFIISVGLILVGIHKLINSIIRRDEIDKSWLSMLIALLLIVTGIYLTVKPFISLLLLTMGVALYFILEGINAITLSIKTRKILKYWWIGILTGLLQFALAFIIIFGLPTTALITLGILIGINMIFTGINFISVYAGAKKLAEND